MDGIETKVRMEADVDSKINPASMTQYPAGEWREPTEAELEIKESQLFTTTRTPASNVSPPQPKAPPPSVNLPESEQNRPSELAPPRMPSSRRGSETHSGSTARRVSSSALSLLGLRSSRASSATVAADEANVSSNVPGAFPGSPVTPRSGTATPVAVQSSPPRPDMSSASTNRSRASVGAPSGVTAARATLPTTWQPANRNPLLRSISHLHKDAPSISQSPPTPGSNAPAPVPSGPASVAAAPSSTPPPSSGFSVGPARSLRMKRAKSTAALRDPNPPPYRSSSIDLSLDAWTHAAPSSPTALPSGSRDSIVFTSPFTGQQIEEPSHTLPRVATRQPSLPSILAQSIKHRRGSASSGPRESGDQVARTSGLPPSSDASVSPISPWRISRRGSTDPSDFSLPPGSMTPRITSGGSRVSFDVSRADVPRSLFSGTNHSRDSLGAGSRRPSFALPGSTLLEGIEEASLAPAAVAVDDEQDEAAEDVSTDSVPSARRPSASLGVGARMRRWAKSSDALPQPTGAESDSNSSPPSSFLGIHNFGRRSSRHLPVSPLAQPADGPAASTGAEQASSGGRYRTLSGFVKKALGGRKSESSSAAMSRDASQDGAATAETRLPSQSVAFANGGGVLSADDAMAAVTPPSVDSSHASPRAPVAPAWVDRIPSSEYIHRSQSASGSSWTPSNDTALTPISPMNAFIGTAAFGSTKIDSPPEQPPAGPQPRVPVASEPKTTTNPIVSVSAASGPTGAAGDSNDNGSRSGQAPSRSAFRQLPRLNSMRAVSGSSNASGAAGGDDEESDHGHQSGGNVGDDDDITTDDDEEMDDMEEVSETEDEAVRSDSLRPTPDRPGHLVMPPVPNFTSFGAVGRESWVAFNATPSSARFETPTPVASGQSSHTTRGADYFNVMPAAPSAQALKSAEEGGPPPSPSVITRSRPTPWGARTPMAQPGRVSARDMPPMEKPTLEGILKPSTSRTRSKTQGVGPNANRPSTSAENRTEGPSLALEESRESLLSRRSDKRKERVEVSMADTQTARPQLYHHASRSMINLSTAADRRKLLLDENEKQGRPELHLNITHQPVIGDKEKTPVAAVTSTPGLARRRSMFEIRTEPPPYSIMHLRPDGPQIIYPREEEGKEKLPKYSCHVHIEGYLPRKMEFSAPGVQARDRSWRRLYFVLHGTMLRVYKQDLSSAYKDLNWTDQASGVHVHPEPINEDDSTTGSLATARDAMSHLHIGGSAHTKGSILRTYTMQNAESGLAADYLKRRHVVRVRAEGEQFLLQTRNDRHVVDWIEALQAATNVAVDLETRPMPKFITLPRRRRRRRRNPDAASPLTEREQAEIAEAQRRSLAEQNGATRAPVSRASASPANDPSDDFEAMLREDQENNMRN